MQINLVVVLHSKYALIGGASGVGITNGWRGDTQLPCSRMGVLLINQFCWSDVEPGFKLKAQQGMLLIARKCPNCTFVIMIEASEPSARLCPVSHLRRIETIR